MQPTTGMEAQPAPAQQVVYVQGQNPAYAPQGANVVYQQPPAQQPVQVVYQQPQQVVANTGQPQVVYVQQAAAPQAVAPQQVVYTNANGETSGQTQVVVAQPPITGAVELAPDRKSRWAYLVLMIGFSAYHLISFWFFFWISLFLPDGHGTMFFFCGAVPAIICFAWTVNDSTVYCCNPAGQAIAKMCCCECINPFVMIIPMAIAAFLRFIFWIYMTSLVLDFVDDSHIADNIFWFFLTFTTLDLGPIVVISVDWWYYYNKLDYQAILGTHKNPTRCVVAMSIVIMIASYSIIGMTEGTGELWLVIMHAVTCTIIIAFLSFCNFSGQITENVIGNKCFRIACFILGGFVALWLLTTWINAFILMSWLYGFGGFMVFVYMNYLNSLMVPIIWGLFSYKVDQPVVPNSV